MIPTVTFGYSPPNASREGALMDESNAHGTNERLRRRTFLKGVAAGAVGLGLSGAFPRDLRAEEEAPATTGEVKTRLLGRTKLPVSVVTYGGGALNPDAVRLLEVAVERGVNFIDTAQNYGGGQSEAAVGTFLASYPHRDKVFVNTKASKFRRPSGTASEVYAALEANVRESLGRLQTDYVDVFMWPHGASDVGFLKDGAVRDGLKKLQEKGLVRFLGMSSHANYKAVCEAVVEDGFYDVFLTVINVCTLNAAESGTPPAGRRQPGRPAEDVAGLVKMAKKKNVGVMAMKVANPGYLSSQTDALLDRAYPGASSLSRHQRLYRYALDHEGVCTDLVGIRNVTHLKEAVELAAL